MDVFDRFFGEVTAGPGDLSRHWRPSYRRIFTEELPATLHRLDSDPSPEAQVWVAVTCNLVVGVIVDSTEAAGIASRRLKPLQRPHEVPLWGL